MTKPSEIATEPIELVPHGPHGPIFSDFQDVIQATYWLFVLASRPLYATLSRTPVPEHLVHLIDIFITYAARGSRYYDEDFEPVPWEQREPLARALRRHLEAWTPPELPHEITDVARALLHAEGHEEPKGGWDCFQWEGPEAVEDALLWPEGVPLILRRQAEEEAAAASADPSAPPMTVEEFLGPKPERTRDRGHIEISAMDDWNGVGFWTLKVVPAPDGTSPRGAEFGDSSCFIIWLMVLASPPLYRTLERRPDRDHLLRLIDAFLIYAAGGLHLTPVKKSRRRFLRLDQRDALARKLRALVEAWSLSDIPSAITDAARELVEAEGIQPPKGGWDTLAHDRPGPLEDVLLWPEGVPIFLDWATRK